MSLAVLEIGVQVQQYGLPLTPVAANLAPRVGATYRIQTDLDALARNRLNAIYISSIFAGEAMGVQ